MAKYVLRPDAVMWLASREVVPSPGHELLAPTLLRSEVLSALYGAVRRGEMAKSEAGRQLDCIRGLKLRLLGDRVLQARAWTIADQLGWPGTLEAEYVALTQLQGDALVTLDKGFARAVRGVVTVAKIDDLLAD